MRSSKRKKRRTELFEDKRALGKILIEQCWVGRTEMLVVEEVNPFGTVFKKNFLLIK